MSAPTDLGRDGNSVDLLLAAFSAGALDPALHALVASHLLLSPRNRAFVRALDSLAGAELEAISPVPLSDPDRRLAEIFAAPEPAPRPAPQLTVRRLPPVPEHRPGDIILPEPLRAFVGADPADLRWRTLVPGVRDHVVERSGRGEAKLIWARAGRKMPRHTHEGSEVTLVLAGGFRDATGTYHAGDIIVADAELDHQPVTLAEEDCLCFAVTDAPLHLTGPFGRIVDRLLTPR